MELSSQSDPALRALIAQRSYLQTFDVYGPFDFMNQLTGPDANALRSLNQSASSGADWLRAVIDLLSVYDNLQCDADRAMLKPLLKDRLNMYSRLLNVHAEGKALLLDIIKQDANKKARAGITGPLGSGEKQNR